MNLSGWIVNNNDFIHWHALLEVWTKLVIDYCEIDSDDPPWWQNEVSNTAMLSTAASILGRASMVDSSIPKDAGNGRCDLFIRLSSGEIECIEAKKDRGNYKTNNYYKNSLELAVNDALKVNFDAKKIGISFNTVRSDGDFTDNELQELLKTLSPLNLDAVAWVFPEKSRRLQNNQGSFSPGMVLLIKQAHERANG